MILYYAPGACSQACHIALIEAGLPYRLVKVGRDRQTEDGRDFNMINPKGYTPALDLEDGGLLTENLAILFYIAEKSGKLLPTHGMDRFRAIEATAFMTTEIHRHFVPLFNPNAVVADKESSRASLGQRFAIVDKQLGNNGFLIGEEMTVADAYLIVMLSWASSMNVAVSERLTEYLVRMNARASVAKANIDEGLA